MTVAVSMEPTLRKLGAHLRWFIEKNGVNSEDVIVSIGVKSENDRSLLISGFLREFDKDTMKRWDKAPDGVQVHGVKVFVVLPKSQTCGT